MSEVKPKSSRLTAGSIDTEHVSLNLLKANDFVAGTIREKLKNILELFTQQSLDMMQLKILMRCLSE